MSFFQSRKKLLIIGIVIILLIAIPLTLYILQKQQENRSHAQAATTLSFTPTSTQSAPIQAKVGDTVSLDVTIDPGVNQVSFVKVDIQYDPTKLEASADDKSFVANTAAFPAVLEEPSYTSGHITATLSVGADPTKVIQSSSPDKKVATITFKTLAKTDAGSPTVVNYNVSQTQALSIASTDQASENVLLPPVPAYIAIGDAAEASGTPTPTTDVTDTPAPTPTAEPTDAPEPTATPAPDDQASDNNEPPVCTALNVDRATSGQAPLALTFTGVGTDSDGTISKATFNFGDGPVQDVTSAGGIGTNSVSAQVSHTYNNPGTYQASVILTDDGGAASTASSCTQTVTVEAAAAAGGTGGGEQGPVAVASPTPAPSEMVTGPNDTLLGIGAVIGAITIVGGLLFFVL